MHPCRTALIYSPFFGTFNYGDNHPFKMQRNRLAYDLMDDYGLLELPNMQIRDCRPASDELLLSFHDPAYIARLKEFSASEEPRADFRFGLGDADCPVFKGLYDYAAMGAGSYLRSCPTGRGGGVRCRLQYERRLASCPSRQGLRFFIP